MAFQSTRSFISIGIPKFYVGARCLVFSKRSPLNSAHGHTSLRRLRTLCHIYESNGYQELPGTQSLLSAFRNYLIG